MDRRPARPEDEVSTLTTPAGAPGLEQDRGQRVHRQRGVLRRLHDRRAPRGQGRRDLARPHRQREVPRRDEQARTHGPLDCEDAAGAAGGRRVAAVHAHGLLGEPAEELRGVPDLRVRLGQALAHLEADHDGEVLGPLDHQLIGTAQHVAAGAGIGRRPRVLGGRGGVQRGQGVLGRRVGHRSEGSVGGRVLHVEGGTTARLPPGPADEQLSRDGVQHRAGGGQVEAGGHVARHAGAPEPGRSIGSHSKSTHRCSEVTVRLNATTSR